MEKFVYKDNPSEIYDYSEEYIRITKEGRDKLDKIFSNGFTVVTMISVIWTLAISAFIGLIASDNWEKVIKEESLLVFFVGFMQFFLFALPVLIIYPFSIKYKENFRGVAGTSIYVRAFFELPAFIAKKQKGETKHHFHAWESVHCELKLKRLKYVSGEYFIMALASIILSLANGVYYSISLFNVNFSLAIVYSAIVLLLTITLIRLIISIFKNTSTRRNMKEIYNIYLISFLNRAKDFGLFKEEDEAEYLKYISELEERDTRIELHVRNKHKKRFFNMRKKIFNLRKLGFWGSLKEVKKMYKGLPFKQNDKMYLKLLEKSEETCEEYSKLKAKTKLTNKDKKRKNKLINILFPIHGKKIYDIGAGIKTVIGLVDLGNNCYINVNVTFNKNVLVNTGDYFICAPNVTFGSEDEFLALKNISIGSDVWLCCGSKINDGANILDGVVLTIGSVVFAKSALMPDSIYSGNPAITLDKIDNRKITSAQNKKYEPNEEELKLIEYLKGKEIIGNWSEEFLKFLRGEKYNSLDDCMGKINNYTHSLCAEFAFANKERRNEIIDMLFPFKGKDCKFECENIFIDTIGSVRLGDNVCIKDKACLMGNIIIGDNCEIGNNVSIISVGHELQKRYRHVSSDLKMINTSGKTVIKSGVKIGDNCMIYSKKGEISENIDSGTIRSYK